MWLAPRRGCPSVFDEIATAVIHAEGTVLNWSRAAEELLDRTAAEVCGKPVGHLLADACERWPGADADETGIPCAGRALLRHRSGDRIEVAFRAVPLQDSSLLVLAAPARRVTDWEQGGALLRALLAQDRIGVGVHDADMTVVRSNITPEMFGGPGLPTPGRLGDVMAPQVAEEVEAALRRVLDTGVPLVQHEQQMYAQAPARLWSALLSALRLEDAQGRPSGVVVLLTDSTAQQRARRELELRFQASVRIGASLDVERTAQDIVDVLVPAFGDFASVDLADAVLEGEEPPEIHGGGDLHLHRTAVASVTGPWPAGLLQPGDALPPWPDHPVLRSYQRGEAVFLDRAGYVEAFGTPEILRSAVPEGGRSAMAAPLLARGLLLGSIDVWRTEQREPFDQQDADLLSEIASRAALSVDNARRYTREHRAAVALQQRLLPRATTDSPAADTAGLYLPAGGGAEVSGDWFDVIPLPSLRCAFVVGDVIGRGLAATATMGRLRAAIQTLADLELDPTELLTHLDDLVARLTAEAGPEQQDTIGGTCLYALYDPVTGRCALASAGHPPPVVVRPDGTARILQELSPGPPLGVGCMPFETTTVDLAPGSVLGLYTDGLIECMSHDADTGLRHLADSMGAHCRPGRPLEETGRALLAAATDLPPRDDIALLLARTRVLPPHGTAAWEFPADPAVVAEARAATVRQLAAWGLDDLAFTTELVVSELVTNAVRYAGGPIGLRLIHEHVLVCEVTDPSNTQPRLRRARWADEGGRGLFLVAQLTARWGSRYDQSGKTIWAELHLSSADAAHHGEPSGRPA
ncbi:SpoIIE family protein phosphatase [Streptomyces sp. NK08204]|uniref:ATP-binding SpoIIE family protein phosphatase n=1 Tax=Streptomyces sp. NK08204 TaxID=2873260 RepID=UPI001CEC8780|nr:SpoIIE family protein phosphatase [Streptomyces sp. NK08204]